MMEQTNFLHLAIRQQVLCATWHPISAIMTDDDFRKTILQVAEWVSKHRPQAVYVDSRQCLYTIPVHLQQWHDDIIIPQYAEAGVKKFAFLQLPNFIDQVAHEQTFSEGKAKAMISTRFFSQEADAWAWVS
jgi:hypothetical protein